MDRVSVGATAIASGILLGGYAESVLLGLATISILMTLALSKGDWSN